MSRHVASAFREELIRLDDTIARMGGLAEHNLVQAFEALALQDPQLAHKVILSDAELDRLRKEIEQLVLSMIARRQPLALDLRQVIAAQKISGDLERIGDLATNLARHAITLSKEKFSNHALIKLRDMMKLALSQLKDVMDAYAERNASLALAVWHRDQGLDAIYASVFDELLKSMVDDPRKIGLCMRLMLSAKDLERIGDHTTNVAEVVYYLVIGNKIDEDRPRGDTPY